MKSKNKIVHVKDGIVTLCSNSHDGGLDFPDSPTSFSNSCDVSQAPSVDDLETKVSKQRASSTNSIRIIKMLKNSSGQPKASDYDETLRRAILLAVAEFHCNISMVQAFPASEMEHKMLGIAWEEVCKCILLDLPSLTPSITKLVNLYHLIVT